MCEIAIPQRERLHEDPCFQHDVERYVGQSQFGVDEVPAGALQNDCKIEVAVRAVIATRPASRT
jgi:hypothetical protein